MHYDNMWVIKVFNMKQIKYLLWLNFTANDLENCKNACVMILAKIVEDPQSGTCLNVSYADVNGPVANPNPTGSPFASTPSVHLNQTNNNFNTIANPLSAGTSLYMLSCLVRF